MSERYWTDDERDALLRAESYTDLFVVAQTVLERMPRPRGQMCGPITTGGAGTVAANVVRFEIAYEHIVGRGVEIFDQMPFEEHMQRVKRIIEPEAPYPTQLLDDFYLPIFENRLVDTLFFLPEWQTSRGATWEHEQATRLGIPVEYLPDDLFSDR